MSIIPPCVIKYDDIPPKDNNEKITDKINENNNNDLKNGSTTKLFIVTFITGITLGIVLQSNTIDDRPKYWIFVNVNEVLLTHVYLVLERFGYERVTKETPWDLLWAHEYPFTPLKSLLMSLKPHQRVNHFPGSWTLSNKVYLATTESKYIPKAFQLPKNKENFLKYAAANVKAIFVQKNNDHRGVVLKNVTEMDETGSIFVQEYVSNPFLLDGFKFDIGVYVVLTSVDPLRLYYYNGDVLIRHCKEKYHPFDPNNVNKYVIAGNYSPIWELPSMARTYIDFGHSIKDAFDIYLRFKGKNPTRMWEEIYEAIRDIFVKKEKHVIEAMFRVDLIIDEDLNVYLLEANMSPNLHSPKLTYQLLYEQVLYSLFSIVGLGQPRHFYPSSASQEDCRTTTTMENYDSCLKKQSRAEMLSADKNIAVWGDECHYSCNGNCGGICALCHSCLTPSDRDTLLQAYREHLHRAEFKRIFPPPMTPNSPIGDLRDLSPKNQLMHMWYQGKCNLDVTWCN